MTREDHLCFCCVCTNRKFTHEFGFICGLTNQKADFKNLCPSFNLDKKERVRRNQGLIDEINDSINRQKTWVKKILDDKPKLNFIINENKNTLDIKSNEAIVVESKTKKSELFIYGILSVGLIIYSVIKEGINFLDYGVILIILAMIFGGAFLVFLFFKKKEILRIGKPGIIIDKTQFIAWHQVRFAFFKTSKVQNEIVDQLIIVQEFGDNLEINLQYSSLEKTQLGLMFYRFLKENKMN